MPEMTVGMKTLNILILDTGREWGGGTNSLLELLKRTDKERFTFHLLFYHNYRQGGGRDIRSAVEALGITFSLLEQKKQSLLVKICKELARALFFFSRPLKKQAVFFIDRQTRIKRNARRIADILKESGTDLLYMNNQPSSNLEGIIASGTSGVPAIQHSRIEMKLNPFEVRAANQYLSKIICVSQGVKDTLAESGVEPSRCVVVYNGISAGAGPLRPPEEIKREWGVKDNEFMVGTVGSLIKRKRITELIEALYLIKGKTAKPIKCLILGEGPEKDNLKDLAVKRGLSDNVIFTGFQPDALSFINAMDIFVMPSEKEGFPRVMLEAMLMRKPVIASRIRGTEELVVEDETGIMYKKGDVGELAACLIRLISSASMMDKMGNAGKERVLQNFSIERYVEQVSDILSGVGA